MKLALGCIRRADQDFGMIEPGDRVAVGLSGGKDSLLLIAALSLYRKVRDFDFSLRAIMLTTTVVSGTDSTGMGSSDTDSSGTGLSGRDSTGMGSSGADSSGYKQKPDTSAIEAFCQKWNVPLTVRHTDLYEILFEIRKEENPCALCAKMRRAMLCDFCRESDCNKLALAHHREDALETLMMSLLFEGRLHTFHPKTWLSRSQVTVIRPMVYLPEKHVVHMKKELDFPVLENPCPANGYTKRQEMKELLAELCKRYPNAKDLMLTALRRDERYGLWQRR